MAWRSWSAYANVPTDPQISVQRVRERERHDTNASWSKIRTRILATFKWAGVDQTTMLWHTQNFDPRFVAEQTSAQTGAWILVDDTNAITNDTSVTMDNWSWEKPAIRKNWHLFFNTSDGTLYTVSTGTTGTAYHATVSLTPALTQGVDNDTQVFWLRVTESRGDPIGGGGYDVIQTEETVTDWATVYQSIDEDL